VLPENFIVVTEEYVDFWIPGFFLCGKEDSSSLEFSSLNSCFFICYLCGEQVDLCS